MKTTVVTKSCDFCRKVISEAENSSFQIAGMLSMTFYPGNGGSVRFDVEDLCPTCGQKFMDFLDAEIHGYVKDAK